MLANVNHNVKTENDTIKVHISKGNVKVGFIPNWSLVPGRTCSPEACETCLVNGCYACKSYRMYPSVRKAWDENTELALHNLPEMEKQINAYITKHKPEFFRVHVAGDFVTREYAETWVRIARANPGTRFLAFTKYWDNVRGIDFPENFSLVLSGWPGTTIPADLLKLYATATMIETMADHNDRDMICPGNCETCGACWSLAKRGINVEFLKH